MKQNTTKIYSGTKCNKNSYDGQNTKTHIVTKYNQNAQWNKIQQKCTVEQKTTTIHTENIMQQKYTVEQNVKKYTVEQIQQK